jgi:hypothetical protein
VIDTNELRQKAAALDSAGWRESARRMNSAASEIDSLRAQLAEARAIFLDHEKTPGSEMMCVDTDEMRAVATKVKLLWSFNFGQEDLTLVEAWQLLLNAANEIDMLRRETSIRIITLTAEVEALRSTNAQLTNELETRETKKP